VPRDWERPDGWVRTCLDDVATRPWSVVVVHDLPTGAMDHLPTLLDGLDAMGAEVVQEFPEACIPVRRGVRTGAFDLHPLT
jgi:peptidoglycan-N-acetylglucosamine deacetylase